jgi:hypothetical protein
MRACKDGKFNTVGQTVTLQDAAYVVAHRVGADGQAGRYGFIAQAVRWQDQNLGFSWCALNHFFLPDPSNVARVQSIHCQSAL